MVDWLLAVLLYRMIIPSANAVTFVKIREVGMFAAAMVVACVDAWGVFIRILHSSSKHVETAF